MKFKNGEFPFGFQGFGKNRGVGWLQADNKIRKKCKIEPLEVLGHWGWIPRATRVSRVLSSR